MLVPKMHCVLLADPEEVIPEGYPMTVLTGGSPGSPSPLAPAGSSGPASLPPKGRNKKGLSESLATHSMVTKNLP